MRFKNVNFFLFALAIFILTPSGSQAQDSQSDQHIEVSLRMIGHQLLLNSGDSTSRVLPIKRENGKYRIPFEVDFALNPDDLVNTVNRIMKETKMANGYIVEVKQCKTDEVVYSYEMGDLEKIDIIPCLSRSLPRSCYSLLFTLLEREEPVSQTSELSYFTITLLLILLVGVFYFLLQRRRKSLSDPNVIALGDYRFDKRNTELLFDQERIVLTSKESDLLILLYNAVNTTIERDVILNRVWGDEGDYAGRTLDVFISKLRKKLEADPKLKIVNIRGVGYKLVMDV